MKTSEEILEIIESKGLKQTANVCFLEKKGVTIEEILGKEGFVKSIEKSGKYNWVVYKNSNYNFEFSHRIQSEFPNGIGTVDFI